MAIVRRGAYVNRFGRAVDLAAVVAAMVAGTRLVRPDDWDGVIAAGRRAAGSAAAEIEVTGETTLAAAARLGGSVAALNFASARTPGGGFLSGSGAQEESLARSSALHASLVGAPAYYEANAAADARYTDHAILSPRVPVFRDDDGTLRDAPQPVTFVTMPAPNVSAMPVGSPLRAGVGVTVVRRARCVLALAAHAGCRQLVLGGWGCGVFGNDPAVVADAFALWLADDQPWRRCFDRVAFAVYDPTPARATFAAFARRFGREPAGSARSGVGHPTFSAV